MKLTWFGNETFRLHTGGEIVVVLGQGEIAGIDAAELVSGAGLVVRFAEVDPVADPAAWRPRAALRPMEEDEAGRVPQVWALAPSVLVIDADGEAPLVLSTGALPKPGKWVDRAVIVLAGEDMAGRGSAVLETSSPRLLALAGEDGEVDAAFAQLRDRLDGTGMVALERGLAVEV